MEPLSFLYWSSVNMAMLGIYFGVICPANYLYKMLARIHSSLVGKKKGKERSFANNFYYIFLPPQSLLQLGLIKFLWHPVQNHHGLRIAHIKPMPKSYISVFLV